MSKCIGLGVERCDRPATHAVVYRRGAGERVGQGQCETHAARRVSMASRSVRAGQVITPNAYQPLRIVAL